MTNIYTLWARLPNDEGAWMIAAEDEYCWEGDPARCEQKFKEARETHERSGFDVREVWIEVDHERIEVAFRPTQVTAEVIDRGRPESLDGINRTAAEGDES